MLAEDSDFDHGTFAHWQVGFQWQIEPPVETGSLLGLASPIETATQVSSQDLQGEVVEFELARAGIELWLDKIVMTTFTPL